MSVDQLLFILKNEITPKLYSQWNYVHAERLEY